MIILLTRDQKLTKSQFSHTVTRVNLKKITEELKQRRVARSPVEVRWVGKEQGSQAHSSFLRLTHHLKQTSHHPSLPLSSIPDLKRTCSTNPSHHRSPSYPPTAHWTSTGLPSRTSYHPALCFSSSVIFLLVDACVGLNWLIVSFFITR